MKEYKLVFKPLSTITNIPNAQTIFGAICNIIVNTQGEEALNNYISSFNNHPLFIHSSMFPLNMLPMVHYNIFDIDYINHNILKEKSIDQLSYLQTLKNYKKINYTTESIFNDYIIKSDFNKMRDDLLNKKINIKNYCLQKASENISKISDELLNSMKEIKAEETTEMLVNLTKIMDKFDVKEIKNIKQESFVSKIFKSAGNTIARLFQKYDTMGYEVEKVYVLLKKYESDIKESNNKLKRLYDGNMAYYQELEKYIVAGELALEEVEQYIYQIPLNNTISEEEKNMMVQKLEMCKEMLNQRIYDLRIAENVAIQAAPMLQSMQMSNFNLMRKINSSFIVTLPIFKQCLAQAVLLKRQEIQAKSLKQLDDKTNELIMRNAANTSRQSVEIAKMASSSSVAIETLEKSYETIMRGIEETKAIQQSNALARKENTTKLESIKMTMKKSISL